MSEYGSGLSLDQYYDLEIDPTGDTVSVDGLEEVAKDSSLRVQEVANDEYSGSVIRGNRKQRLESEIVTALERDDRIFRAEAVARGNPSNDSIDVSLLIFTDLGLIEDVVSL